LGHELEEQVARRRRDELNLTNLRVEHQRQIERFNRMRERNREVRERTRQAEIAVRQQRHEQRQRENDEEAAQRELNNAEEQQRQIDKRQQRRVEQLQRIISSARSATVRSRRRPHQLSDVADEPPAQRQALKIEPFDPLALDNYVVADPIQDPPTNQRQADVIVMSSDDEVGVGFFQRRRARRSQQNADEQPGPSNQS
jgi:hypothetical protein